MTAIQIFTNQAADGQSSEFTINGIGTVQVAGTFDSGSVNLQIKLANTNSSFSNVDTSQALTETGSFDLKSVKGAVFRLDLSGSTSPTINAFVENSR